MVGFSSPTDEKESQDYWILSWPGRRWRISNWKCHDRRKYLNQDVNTWKARSQVPLSSLSIRFPESKSLWANTTGALRRSVNSCSRIARHFWNKEIYPFNTWSYLIQCHSGNYQITFNIIRFTEVVVVKQINLS